MKFTREDIDGLIPNIRGLVDPRVEQRLQEAFRRIYEIMLLRFEEQKKEFDSKLESIATTTNANLNGLIGAFSQPLIGGNEADPILQSIVSSYGPQLENTFLAGPIPSFRPITLTDLPAIPATPASQLNADGEILDINVVAVGEYLKRIGNTVVGGFPVGTNNLVEGIIPTVEGIFYTVPAGYKTLFRFLILENTTGGNLDVDIRTTNGGGVTIYSNTFTVNANSTITLILNLVLEATHTIRGDTTLLNAVNFFIFGSQEPL